MYFDTDSVIFTSGPGEWVPRLGDYLGELTNELDDDEDHISTFVSGGPKNYAYQTKNGKTICNVRGFTLNYRGSQKIFSTMCEQVCRPNGEAIFLENPHIIKRDAKTKTIHTVPLKKKYKLVYDKRVVCGLDTFPYGYR